MENNKIAFLYNDNVNMYVITHRREDERLDKSSRQEKRQVIRSINKKLNSVFKKIKNNEEFNVEDACMDVYLLYTLGDKRVNLLNNFKFEEVHNKDINTCTISKVIHNN